MEEGWLSSDMLGDDEQRRAGAYAQGARFVLLQKEDIDPRALMLIPEALSRKHSVIAYRSSEQGVEVALLALRDLEAIDHLRETMRIAPRLTDRASMTRALIAYQKHLKETYGEKIKDDTNAPRALNVLLSHALSQDASDVHIEPRGAEWLVRYRIRGSLYDAMALRSARALLSELKHRAALSPTLATTQEGRFAAEAAGQEVIVRVSTVPTVSGERALLRLVRQSGSQGAAGFTLQTLGFHGESLELMHQALRRKTGLIAVAGPQGSGKTTTLYTLLDLLASPSHALATLEEQVEYRLPYASQTQVQTEIGLTFAAGLRALLRQDPDVVMLGALPSHEVVELAHGAARRTLFLVAAEDESLARPDVLVRQQLAGKLCQQCKKEYTLNREKLDALENRANFGAVLAALREEQIVEKQLPWKEIIFYTAQGCDECEAGYVGQTGLQEVVSNAGESLNIVEDGLFKAAQGLADVQEILELAQSL